MAKWVLLSEGCWLSDRHLRRLADPAHQLFKELGLPVAEPVFLALNG